MASVIGLGRRSLLSSTLALHYAHKRGSWTGREEVGGCCCCHQLDLNFFDISLPLSLLFFWVKKFYSNKLLLLLLLLFYLFVIYVGYRLHTTVCAGNQIESSWVRRKKKMSVSRKFFLSFFFLNAIDPDG